MKPLREFILGIDPGMDTGFAFVCRDDLAQPLAPSFDSFELPFLQTGSMIEHICKRYRDRLDVACEQFTIGMSTVKNTPAPWSLEVIGVARYFCQIYTGQDLELYEQKPPLCTDDRLKALGWYRPTPNGHANDGARQLLKHLITRGFRDDRLWPEESQQVSG